MEDDTNANSEAVKVVASVVSDSSLDEAITPVVEDSELAWMFETPVVEDSEVAWMFETSSVADVYET